MTAAVCSGIVWLVRGRKRGRVEVLFVWRGTRFGEANESAGKVHDTVKDVSNDDVADELRRFYKDHLQEFDAVYLGSVLSSIHGRQALVVHPE